MANGEKANGAGRRHGVWVIPSVLLVLVISVSGIVELGFGGVVSDEEPEPELRSAYAIFPIRIPDSLEFSGEKVPLENFDVREALDKELMSNTFFHSQTMRLIKKANRYFPVIESILEEEGVPDDFKYLAVAESGLANVVSPAQAVGFWQIRKGTGNDYGLEINSEVDERYHLEKSTIVACRYIRESFEKYGNWTMAAASYNVGRRGIDRQVDRQKQSDYYNLLLNDETARYLFRILSYKLIIEDPLAYGFHISKKDLYGHIPYRIVEVSESVSDFADFANEHGVNYKMLKYLNPWLRDNKLTISQKKSYELKIMDSDFRSFELGEN